MTTGRSEEIIIRRTTADGVTVCVWNDGDLSGRLGHYFRGAKVVKDKTRSMLIADEATLFNSSEMGCLIKAANTLAKKGTIVPGELRALAHKLSEKS